MNLWNFKQVWCLFFKKTLMDFISSYISCFYCWTFVTTERGQHHLVEKSLKWHTDLSDRAVTSRHSVCKFLFQIACNCGCFECLISLTPDWRISENYCSSVRMKISIQVKVVLQVRMYSNVVILNVKVNTMLTVTLNLNFLIMICAALIYIPHFDIW